MIPALTVRRLEVSGLIAGTVVLFTAAAQDLHAVAVQAAPPENFWSLLESRSLTLFTGAISFLAAWRVTAYKVDTLKETVQEKADHKIVEQMIERMHDKLDTLGKGQERLDGRLDVYAKAIISINETLASQGNLRRRTK